MSTRIYIVQTKGKTGTEDTVLVEASTASQALRFVANQTFEARIAGAKEVASYMKQGVKVIDAGDENGTTITSDHGVATINRDCTIPAAS